MRIHAMLTGVLTLCLQFALVLPLRSGETQIELGIAELAMTVPAGFIYVPGEFGFQLIGPEGDATFRVLILEEHHGGLAEVLRNEYRDYAVVSSQKMEYATHDGRELLLQLVKVPDVRMRAWSDEKIEKPGAEDKKAYQKLLLFGRWRDGRAEKMVDEMFRSIQHVSRKEGVIPARQYMARTVEIDPRDYRSRQRTAGTDAWVAEFALEGAVRETDPEAFAKGFGRSLRGKLPPDQHERLLELAQPLYALARSKALLGAVREQYERLLEDAQKNVYARITVWRKTEECKGCDGKGYTKGRDGLRMLCQACEGTGEKGIEEAMIACAHCRGTGKVAGRECQVCGGSGKEKRKFGKKRAKVKRPKDAALIERLQNATQATQEADATIEETMVAWIAAARNEKPLPALSPELLALLPVKPALPGSAAPGEGGEAADAGGEAGAVDFAAVKADRLTPELTDKTRQIHYKLDTTIPEDKLPGYALKLSESLLREGFQPRSSVRLYFRMPKAVAEVYWKGVTYKVKKYDER